MLESGNEEFAYRPSHRKILLAVGTLFSALAISVLFIAPNLDAGSLMPVVVFGGAGMICLIVGTLGNDRAVAKIWGSKK